MPLLPAFTRTQANIDIKCLQLLIGEENLVTTSLLYIKYLDEATIEFYFISEPSPSEIEAIDNILANYVALASDCTDTQPVTNVNKNSLVGQVLSSAPTSWLIELGEAGSVGNEYLRSVTDTGNADRSCYIAPYNCRIKCVMANQRESRPDAELWILRLSYNGDNKDTPDLLFRKSFTSNIMEFCVNDLDIAVNQYDKLAVFIRKRSDNIRDCYCNIYFVLDTEDPGALGTYEYDRNTEGSVFSPTRRPEY